MTKRGSDRSANRFEDEPNEMDGYSDDPTGNKRKSLRVAGVKNVGDHSNVAGGNNIGPMAREIGVYNQYLVTEASFDAVTRSLLPGRHQARWRDPRWLGPRFVSPGGFPSAVEILTRNHFVLLTGSAGSGRSSAALMILDAASTAAASTGAAAAESGRSSEQAGTPVDITVGRIRDLPGPGHSGFTVHSWPLVDGIARGECLRLDLTLAQNLTRDNVERLVDLMHAVRENEAWLAVTASEQIDRSLTAEIRALRATMTRPDPLCQSRVRHPRGCELAMEGVIGDPDVRGV